MEDFYTIAGLPQPLSSLSHLVGGMVFAVQSGFLLRPVWGDWPKFLCVALFAISAVSLLFISSVYHMLMPGTWSRSLLLRMDLAAIFVLIAGTFTPIHGILFSGLRRWGILALIWSVAIIGMIVRIAFFDGITRSIGAVIFLAMGWIGVISVWLMWRHRHRDLMLLAFGGGLLYSIGAVVHAAGWPTLIPYVWGPHETLHFAVLGGLAMHWYLIYRIVQQIGQQHPATVRTIPLPSAETATRPQMETQPPERSARAA